MTRLEDGCLICGTRVIIRPGRSKKATGRTLYVRKKEIVRAYVLCHDCEALVSQDIDTVDILAIRSGNEIRRNLGGGFRTT